MLGRTGDGAIAGAARARQAGAVQRACQRGGGVQLASREIREGRCAAGQERDREGGGEAGPLTVQQRRGPRDQRRRERGTGGSSVRLALDAAPSVLSAQRPRDRAHDAKGGREHADRRAEVRERGQTAVVSDAVGRS